MTQEIGRGIAVICADEMLMRRALQGERFRVQSVFAHAVNLLDDSGVLWTLVSRAMDDAPRTARLDLHDFAGLHLDPAQELHLTEGALMGFGLPYLTWNSTLQRATQRPTLALASSQKLSDAAQLICSVLSGQELGGSPYPEPGRQDIAAHFSRQIHNAAAGLKNALRDGSPAAIRAALDAAVGLGPGTTPSLDDYLVGMLLLASHRSSTLHQLAVELKTYLEAHPEKSTAVSMATLQTAADADFRTALGKAAQALAEDPGSEEASYWITAVLNIGQSSGSDILSGLLAGLEMEQELRGCLWLSQL